MSKRIVDHLNSIEHPWNFYISLTVYSAKLINILIEHSVECNQNID